MPRSTTSAVAVAAVAALALTGGALAAEADGQRRNLKQGGAALGDALFSGATDALPIDALGDLAGAFQPV